jgi:hypothetical protein
VVLAIVITALILIFRKKPLDSEENSSNPINSGSVSSQNAGISLAEAGYPIKKGVSKRKEVYDMQVKLVNDYGANVGSKGPDGDWGTATETAVMKHLKTNVFNSYGHLLAAYSSNPPTANSSNPGWLTNAITTVSNFLS